MRTWSLGGSDTLTLLFINHEAVWVISDGVMGLNINRETARMLLKGRR